MKYFYCENILLLQAHDVNTILYFLYLTVDRKISKQFFMNALNFL